MIQVSCNQLLVLVNTLLFWKLLWSCLRIFFLLLWNLVCFVINYSFQPKFLKLYMSGWSLFVHAVRLLQCIMELFDDIYQTFELLQIFIDLMNILYCLRSNLCNRHFSPGLIVVFQNNFSKNKNSNCWQIKGKFQSIHWTILNVFFNLWFYPAGDQHHK